MGFEKRLKELDLILPNPAPPDFTYVPIKQVDSLLFVSGQLPRHGEGFLNCGKVGREVSEEQARDAAKLCVLNALSQLKRFLGSLEKVEEVIKVTGFVNSAEGFTNQPFIINDASDLLVDIFGEKGRHSRSAVGMAELPFNCSVEIEFIFKKKFINT
jgi:enamine deaminase RidA (YjgF/YER057c/UK114 family)